MKVAVQAARVLVAVITLGQFTAQGGIIFDNFGPGDVTAVSGRIVQGPAVGTIGDVDQAVRIRMGAAHVLLNKLTMAVAAVQGGDGAVTVEIRQDAAGAPGLLVYQLAKPVSYGTPLITTALPLIGLLAANTDYWFVANGTGTFDGSWAFNSIGDQGITAGRANGNPWNVRPIESRYAIRLEGTYSSPVPEPKSMWMFGGGAIALITLAKRLRKP